MTDHHFLTPTIQNTAGQDTQINSGVNIMANIPIVDFTAYSNPKSTHDEIAVAKEIDDAFRCQGFVYLENHGVSKERVEQCFTWVR